MTEGPIFEPEPGSPRWSGEAGWGGRLNAWFHGNMLFAIALMAIIILAIVLLVVKGIPDRRSLTTSVLMTSPTQTPTISETVRKGDSYTLIARRIIGNVLLIEQTGAITRGARLYAETKLAQELKNQPLVVGRAITYEPPHVLDLLYSYPNLSPSQKSKWEAMARNIKF